MHSNARSIKTRIETYGNIVYTDAIRIRMQDPLKQGLKQRSPAFFPLD